MKQERHPLSILSPPPDWDYSVPKVKVRSHTLYSIAGLIVIGLFGLAQYHRLQTENRRLRAENDAVKLSWSRLQGRLASLETTSRQLAEASGLNPPADLSAEIGSGGPANGAAMEGWGSTGIFERQLNQLEELFATLASRPSGWPVRGEITDRFGLRASPFGSGHETHGGLDIAAPYGAAIEATADGVVTFAGAQAGYGNVVVIDHGYGVTTRYGHMSRIEVEAGELVRRGAQVGTVGSTGRSTGPHCHYEVRLNDRPVNPINYLPADRF
jgi:murein DD-endopeptidase MepM/ murein hydrolase activator NlpD